MPSGRVILNIHSAPRGESPSHCATALTFSVAKLKYLKNPSSPRLVHTLATSASFWAPLRAPGSSGATGSRHER